MQVVQTGVLEQAGIESVREGVRLPLGAAVFGFVARQSRVLSAVPFILIVENNGAVDWAATKSLRHARRPGQAANTPW